MSTVFRQQPILSKLMAAVEDSSLRESPHPYDFFSSEEGGCGLLGLKRADSDSVSTALSTEESGTEQRDCDRDEKETLYRHISDAESQKISTMISELQQLYTDLDDSLEPYSITDSTTMHKACKLVLPTESPLMRRRARAEGQVDVL